MTRIYIVVLLAASLIGCATLPEKIEDNRYEVPWNSNNALEIYAAFPDKLGDIPKKQVVDYEKNKPGLGYGVVYRGGDTHLDLYIYDHTIDSIPDDIYADVIVNEFLNAAHDIFEMEKRGGYQDVIHANTKQITLGDYPIWVAEFVYSDHGLERDSFLLFTAIHHKFFKIRLTATRRADGSHRKKMDAILTDISEKLLTRRR